MDEVIARLPTKLQLDWCARGFDDVPWFLPGLEPHVAGVDTRTIRISAERELEAIDPVALAVLAAWADHRKACGAITILDESAKSVHAYRVGLLRALVGKTASVAAPPVMTGKSRILTATHVSNTFSIEPLLREIRPLLHLDKESGEAVLYCFSELLRNVFEHSGSPRGAFVAAGHHPEKERVTIAVADLGVSVPVHIRRKLGGSLNDELALRAALEPRASGSFDMERNAGLGLYTTRRIADMTGGKFWLMTGGLCARQDDGAEPGGHAEVQLSQVKNLWRGTVVALTIRPGGILSFDRTMRAANAELKGGASKTRIRFSKKQPIPGSEVIDIPSDVGNMAQDKVAAEAIRRERILPALRDNKTVTLSFQGISLTTQSFVHALLAEPLRTLGPELSLARLAYLRCSDQVREVIQLVVGYVVDELSAREDATDDPDRSLRTPPYPQA